MASLTIAESIIDREGRGRFKGYSTCSMPTGIVNPRTLTLLSDPHCPVKNLRSKPWDEFATPDAPKLDLPSPSAICRVRGLPDLAGPAADGPFGA